MRTALLVTLPWVVAGLLPTTSNAQRGLLQTAPSGLRTTGLQEDAGGLLGGGPGYRVTFGDERVEFVPALGERAPRTMPLTWRLVSVRRGGDEWAAARPERSWRDRTVAYRRPGFVERYDVRLDGVAQSFVFDRLPGTGGDLVVRLACVTELLPVATDDAAAPLQFELPGVGGVTCGGVTGIDADGRTAAGSLRYDRGALELVLPGSFVDAARLPLVLDPIYGARVALGAASADYLTPDIAFEPGAGVYLVVFARRNSAADHDIWAQRVAADGSAVGGAIGLATGTAQQTGPRVASVAGQGAFVVVWGVGQTPSSRAKVVGRAVRASDGLAGVPVDLAAGLDNFITPDIGGEQNTAFNLAMLVVENQTDDRIYAQRVTVNGVTLTQDATRVDVGVPGAGWRNSRPAISKSGGNAGRYFVAWERTYTVDNRTKIYGAILHRGMSLPQTAMAVSGGASSNYDDDDPAVDGDGYQWVVAWEQSRDVLGASSDNRIGCRSVRFSSQRSFGSRGYFGSGVEVIDTAASLDNPTVAALDGSTLIGFERRNPGGLQVWSVNPMTCTACQPDATRVLLSGQAHTNLAIASQLSGSTAADPNEALMAAEIVDTATGNGDIEVQKCRGTDGVVTTLPGACAASGAVYARCAFHGHNEFHLDLRTVQPSTAVFLVLGFERLDWSCGGCVLVPNPFTGWVVPTGTNSNGDASIGFAIPDDSALTGTQFYQQWLVASPNTGCTTFQTYFHTPKLIEIQ